MCDGGASRAHAALHMADHAAHPGIAHGNGRGGLSISKLNFMTFAAFLAWFGGTGYLLTRYSGIWIWFGFALGTT